MASPIILEQMSSDPENAQSDLSLLERFRAGDQDAALHLYYRYADRLLRLASKETSQDLAIRFDPEDIVQSVFRTFFRRASNGQYEAPEGDELWKLLLVIALNKVRSKGAFHRSGKRDIRKTQSLHSIQHDIDCESEEVARSILKLSLEEIIERQPESHRDVLRARMSGLDVQSIADRTKKSKRTVERVLQSFRNELLKDAVKAAEEEPS